MPLYHYTAYDQSAKKQQGVIEAQNEKEAKFKLRDRGLMVSSLSTKAAVSSKDNLTDEQQLTFTLQLSQLVGAGVPLYQSLLAIEEQYEKERAHRILLSLCDQIKAGASLSTALKSFPGSFDRLYVSMVAAGEASGSLTLVLTRLTELLKKQMKIKKEISSALIYPAILSGFCLVVIALLLGFVIPSIEKLFEDRPINNFTRFVIGLSHFFREKWWIYIPVVAGLIFFVRQQYHSEIGRKRIEKIMMRLPMIRTLVIQAAIARLSRTLATLQQGGLTLTEALPMARGVLNNYILEAELAEAEKNIMEGSSLSAELKKSHYIPPLVARMVAIGEESGASVAMLTSIADMYEDQLEKALSRCLALAQPIILIVMGGIIGLVMLAILLPLSDITSLMQG